MVSVTVNMSEHLEADRSVEGFMKEGVKVDLQIFHTITGLVQGHTTPHHTTSHNNTSHYTTSHLHDNESL